MRDIAILAHPSSLPSKSSLRKARYVVSTSLEMATACNNTTDHTPSIKDQVTELAKGKLENQIKL